jgi:hypothetical protein
MFDCTIDHLGEFLAVDRRPFAVKAELASFNRKPRWISVMFFRHVCIDYFAQMCVHEMFLRVGGPLRILGVHIAGKWMEIYANISAGFFHCFSGSSGGSGEIILDPPFWKGPASGAGFHEEKFYLASSNSIADCSNMFG